MQSFQHAECLLPKEKYVHLFFARHARLNQIVSSIIEAVYILVPASIKVGQRSALCMYSLVVLAPPTQYIYKRKPPLTPLHLSTIQRFENNYIYSEFLSICYLSSQTSDRER